MVRLVCDMLPPVRLNLHKLALKLVIKLSAGDSTEKSLRWESIGSKRRSFLANVTFSVCACIHWHNTCFVPYSSTEIYHTGKSEQTTSSSMMMTFPDIQPAADSLIVS